MKGTKIHTWHYVSLYTLDTNSPYLTTTTPSPLTDHSALSLKQVYLNGIRPLYVTHFGNKVYHSLYRESCGSGLLF